MLGCLFMIACFLGARMILFVQYCREWTTGVWEGWFWPLIGWIFMPWTTLAYAFATLHAPEKQIFGDWWWFVFIAVLIDLGFHSRDIVILQQKQK